VIFSQASQITRSADEIHFSCMKIDIAVIFMLIIIKLHKVFSLVEVLKQERLGVLP
jgi:hypothetical protein